MSNANIAYKQRVSYADREVFVGIDVHKSFFVVSAVCERELVLTCRVPAGAIHLLCLLRKYFKGGKVRSCYEAGFSGFGLHRTLVEGGVDNIVVHAASVEVNSHNRVKTDKRDSKKLAVQLESGRLCSIQIPSEQQERARLISRTRHQLVKAITRTRIQIRMKLHQFGLIAREEQRVLTRRMVKNILDTGLSPELDMTIRALLAGWESMLLQQRKLEQEIRKGLKTDLIQQVWNDLPGMGLISSRILADELGDLSQFPNEQSLFSFVGLTPAEYSSGEKVHRGRISRQGRSQLRLVLVEAAWRAIRRDPGLREIFERIATRRGKKRAIVAVARKLVGRARAVFRTKEAYKLNYKKAA